MASHWKILSLLMTSLCAVYFSIYALPSSITPPSYQHQTNKDMLFTVISGILLLAAIINIRIFRQLNKKSEIINKTSEQLSKTNQRLTAILNGTQESIIYTDQAGVIEDANEETEKMLGYTRHELIGNNVELLIPETIRHKHQSYLNNTHIQTKRILGESRQIYCLHKNGEKIPVEITITRLKSDGDTKYVGIIRDVSALLKEREELKKSLAREENLGKQKIKLLSSASHELRTPLNAIIGFTSLLIHNNAENSTDERLNQLQDIAKSADLLLLLVNDLLCYSKIDSGNISIQKSTFNLAEIIRDCVKIKATDSYDKKITIDNKANQELIINSDKLRVKQVLINVLSNAIKYNHLHGKVVIYVEEKSEQIKIYIADNGYGIPEEKLPQLFLPFQRLHSDKTDIEGSGIGLALSKKIINSLDGDISYSPNQQGGSTFIIDLPCTRISAEPPQETSGEKPSQEFSIAGADVLYVEDNIVNVRLMSAILNRLGANMHHVESGEKSLDYLSDYEPDIILMDINLPGISGIETAAAIKQMHQRKHIPIIAVSASITKYHQVNHKLFIDSVVKPFRPDRLAATLAYCLKTNSKALCEETPTLASS